MGWFDFLGSTGAPAYSSAAAYQPAEGEGGMSMDVPGGASGYADPALNPSGNPNVELGGSQGVGLLGKLGRYAQAMRQAMPAGNIPGTPAQPSAAQAPATSAPQPAAASVPWDATAPDAFAQTQRDRNQLQQWENLAGDIGKWVRTAAMAYGGGGGGV